jgi:hypothetical protein
MTQLKSLTFAALPRLTAADPVIQRRNKLIVRLQQQVQLAQDPNFTLTRQETRPLSSHAAAWLPRQRQPLLETGKHPACDPASAFRTAVALVIAPV